MTPERWQQITGIFHAALARDAAEREAFVASGCGEDEALRHEVSSMLAAHDEAGAFGERPLFSAEEARSADSSIGGVGLAVGSHVGPYEIVSLLGAGGMGAVYRARDHRLQRDVALKVLLPAVANDPDRLARFSREAKALASLNHPNIAQLHDLEETGDVRALVMELVEGPTLADRLARGAIPMHEALAIAKQLAEGLEAAHEHGIVHRDLKPANIKVRPDGTVKVLDFGLAKLVESGAGIADTPDESSAGSQWVMPLVDTVVGTIVGSIAYMAPEQAQGKPVDRRADLWAFGCVLFEILTGRPTFAGETPSDVLVKVIGREPDCQILPAKTPAAIRALVQRCLEKDPKRRLDSAAVARLEIEEALEKPAWNVPGVKRSNAGVGGGRWPYALVWVAAIVLVAGSASIGLFMSREGTNAPLSEPRLRDAMQVTFALDVESYPTWSSDGLRLAYQAAEGSYFFVGNHDIWVAQLGSGEPVNITKHPADDRMPSWSPDGRDIAFFSDRAGDWGVYTAAAIGGSPRHILAIRGMGNNMSWSAPQWSRDGTTLLVPVRQAGENVVIVLSLTSLETTRVVLPAHEGNVCFDLSVSPDGRRFAYVEGGSGQTEVTRLWTTAASGGEAVPLTEGRTNVWSPTWSADGRSVFYVSNRGGSMDLWQQAVAGDGTAVGEPLVVTQGLGIRSATFSPDGARLAYTRGGRISNVWRVPILPARPATWADAAQLTSERAFIEFVDAAPDGEQLAVSSDRRGNQDLWLLPAAGGEMTRLTADPTPDWAPRWSPDGNEIAFYSYRSGNRDVWVIPSEGGPARQLTAHPAQNRNPRWSPDGHHILFHSSQSEGRGWWILDAKGGEGRFLLTSGDSGDDGGDWAPDGQSLVLSRQNRLYRVPTAGGEPVLLPPTRERPFSPRFSRDGQSIYYSVITGPREDHDLWKLSLADGKTSRLTKLEGRRGRLGYFFTADARYLYLTWYEDEGDIWVMDVVTDNNR